jgi:hypothetical protein
MKHKTTLSMAIALSVLMLSLMTSDSRANVETSHGWVADSGMVTLGPNQSLRITVTPTTLRNRTLRVSFNAQTTTVTCGGGVCTHTVTTETTTVPVTLMPGQAASYDIDQPAGASAVRGRVFADSPEMQVNGLFVDTLTGMTTSMSGAFRIFVNVESLP